MRKCGDLNGDRPGLETLCKILNILAPPIKVVEPFDEEVWGLKRGQARVGNTLQDFEYGLQ